MALPAANSLPVYDLQGRPLGFFPLAPGLDASTLRGGSTPARAVATPSSSVPAFRAAIDGATAVAASAARSASNGSLSSARAASPPRASGIASAPAPPPGSAAAASQRHRPTPRMLTRRAPQGGPADQYVSPTPAILVSGGDVGVPSGAATVSSAGLVPAGAGAAPNTPFMFSLEAAGDAIAEARATAAAATARADAVDAELRLVRARERALEARLRAAEAILALDGDGARDAGGGAGDAAADSAAARSSFLATLATGGSVSAGAGIASGDVLGTVSDAAATPPLSTRDCRVRLARILSLSPLLSSIPSRSLSRAVLPASTLLGVEPNQPLQSASDARATLVVDTAGSNLVNTRTLTGQVPFDGDDASGMNAGAGGSTLLVMPAKVLQAQLLSRARVVGAVSHTPAGAAGDAERDLIAHAARHAALLRVASRARDADRANAAAALKGGVADEAEGADADAGTTDADTGANVPAHLAARAALWLHLLSNAPSACAPLPARLHAAARAASRFWRARAVEVYEYSAPGAAAAGGAGEWGTVTLRVGFGCDARANAAPMHAVGAIGLAAVSARTVVEPPRARAPAELVVPLVVSVSGGSGPRVAGVLRIIGKGIRTGDVCAPPPHPKAKPTALDADAGETPAELHEVDEDLWGGRGSTDSPSTSPALVFTRRDEELGGIVARWISDALSAAAAQALELRAITGGALRSDGASGGSADGPSSAPPPAVFLPLSSAHATLAWRALSFEGPTALVPPLAPRAARSSVSDDDDSDGDGYDGAQSNVQFHSVVDVAAPTAAMTLEWLPPSEAQHGLASSVVPRPSFVYVRAVLCVGDAPVRADAASPPARFITGAAAGALGGGSGTGAACGGYGAARWATPLRQEESSDLLDGRTAAPCHARDGWRVLAARAFDTPRDSCVVFVVHEATSATGVGVNDDDDESSGDELNDTRSAADARSDKSSTDGESENAGAAPPGIFKGADIARARRPGRAIAWGVLPLLSGAALSTGRARVRLTPGENPFTTPLGVSSTTPPREGDAFLTVEIALAGAPRGVSLIDADLARRHGGWFADLLEARRPRPRVAVVGTRLPRPPLRLWDAPSAPRAPPQSASHLTRTGGGYALVAPKMTTSSAAAPFDSGRASPGIAALSASDVALLADMLQISPPGSACARSSGDAWTPARLTPSLRRVLWTHRARIFEGVGPNALPLLARAAPHFFGGPPRASASLSTLVFGSSLPPTSVALQLLGGGGIPSLRAFGAEALLADARTAGPHALALALGAVRDAATARLLMSAATEAPATLGRQVLWALAILARSPALRVRAGAVTRALVDGALPREAAPAAALSKWSVARIAGAVAVSAAAAAGAVLRGEEWASPANAALSASLGTAPLPHTTRLPLEAVAPVIPALYARARADGSLARALSALGSGVGEVAPPPSSSPPVNAASSDDDSDSSDSGADDIGVPDTPQPPQPPATPPPTPREAAAALIQAIEDASALAFASVGAFADSAALGLPSETADAPGELLLRAEEAYVAAVSALSPAPALSPGARALIPRAIFAARAHGAPLGATAAGALAPTPLPFAASVARFLRGGPASHTAPAPMTSLPLAGLCVGAPLVSRARMLAPRGAGGAGAPARAFLCFAAVPDLDELDASLSSPTAALSREPTAAAVGCAAALGTPDAYPGVTKTRAHVLRPLRWRDNVVAIVVSTGATDAALVAEAVAARVLNAAAAAWRHAGCAAGDAAPPYAFGLAPGAPRRQLATPLDEESSETDVPPLAGFLLVPPTALTLLEIRSSAPRGTPAPLARWLMQSVLGAAAGEADGHDGSGAGQFALILKTYVASLAAVTVGAFVLALGERTPCEIFVVPSGHVSLAGLAYTRGVPESSAEHAATARFASPGAMKDLLSVLGAGDSSSRGGVSPLISQLRATAAEAFAAMRLSAQDLINEFGVVLVRRTRAPLQTLVHGVFISLWLSSNLTHAPPPLIHNPLFTQPLAVPGASSPADLQALRTRLLLHETDAQAAFLFGSAYAKFVGLE